MLGNYPIIGIIYRTKTLKDAKLIFLFKGAKFFCSGQPDLFMCNKLRVWVLHLFILRSVTSITKVFFSCCDLYSPNFFFSIDFRTTQ